MDTLILHHYPASPFAEKIRRVLAFKQLAYRSVIIPDVMPKPDVLALTGGHGGAVGKQLRETDVHVGVPHERGARIREVQHLVLHCLCDGIDTQLLGEQEPLE